MQEKKSNKSNILNATIQLVLFVGNIPFVILRVVIKYTSLAVKTVQRLLIALFAMLTKCTRFVVMTILNACKRAVLSVQKGIGKTSKKVTKAFKKVVKMPNKYALKVKKITPKPKVKYVRKRYNAIPLDVPHDGRLLRFARNDRFGGILAKGKIFAGGGLFTLLFIVTPITAYSWYHGLPQPGVLVENAQTHKPTRILDREGVPLYEIYVDKKYAPVALNQIPKNVVLATLAVEDHEFFNHNGVRFLSIARAAKATFVDDSMQGGSTITQQLIKNVLLSPERTVTRKLKEVFLALVVEKKYTKEEILELYLNNIPYGGTAWGIQSAAQKFFGKDVGNLSLGEAAFLAGLPSSPSSYVSYASDIDLAKSRQKLVLDRMEELKIITSQQNVDALAQDLKFVEQAEYIKAPHFVAYVRKELEKKYGRVMVESGGLTVKTSLDLDLHNKLQEVVAEEVAKSGNLNIGNGALVVLDPKTGEILGYVGSIDYYKEGWGAYDVITAMRQPGSAIKVVTYSLALEQGFTPASPIVDAPLTIQLGGGQVYKPVNYDGKYHGTVTLRSALANSYNIPAVKMVKEVGPDNMVTLANKMGLTNWQVDDSYGYSVTLGGKETRLLDLTNVYATLARGGMYSPTTPFISVKDANGFELYADDTREQAQVLSPESAYIMSNILSDNSARTPAFGSRSSLYLPSRTVAVKTGTTNEKRDNYTVGYTPSYVVGVWVGNNDNTPMNPYLASGVSGAAPIWNRAMQIVLEGSKNEEFSVPAGVFVKIDSTCGRSEVFAKGSKIPNLCPVEDKTKKDEEKKKDETN